MADIRIEKKKTIWPWILLVIILGVLAFLYFYGSIEEDETQNTEMEEITYAASIPILHKDEIEIV